MGKSGQIQLFRSRFLFSDKLLDAGMNDYLSKPIEGETLFKMSQAWL